MLNIKIVSQSSAMADPWMGGGVGWRDPVLMVFDTIILCFSGFNSFYQNNLWNLVNYWCPCYIGPCNILLIGTLVTLAPPLKFCSRSAPDQVNSLLFDRLFFMALPLSGILSSFTSILRNYTAVLGARNMSQLRGGISITL